MNAADTAWMIVATALVLFMTLPGLALFYGGLVRARNVLSVFMQCFGIACLMSILWLALGYSIAFGDGNAYWGGLGKAFLSGVDEDTMAGNIPEVLFFAFQMTFAIITPALIVGAYVERIRFGFVMLFSALWVLICYAPVAHWIWGGGMLSGGEGALFAEGVNDFAGGIVVHQTAGIAALIVAAFLGGRRDKGKPPRNPRYGDDRCRDAVGRLVRLQWRVRTGGQRIGRDGADGDACVCRDSISHLDFVGTYPLWQNIPRGSGYRYNRGSGLNHTCVRLHRFG